MISQEQLNQLKDKKVEKELAKKKILSGTGTLTQVDKPVIVQPDPVVEVIRSRSRSPPKTEHD